MALWKSYRRSRKSSARLVSVVKNANFVIHCWVFLLRFSHTQFRDVFVEFTRYRILIAVNVFGKRTPDWKVLNNLRRNFLFFFKSAGYDVKNHSFSGTNFMLFPSYFITRQRVMSVRLVLFTTLRPFVGISWRRQTNRLESWRTLTFPNVLFSTRFVQILMYRAVYFLFIFSRISAFYNFYV